MPFGPRLPGQYAPVRVIVAGVLRHAPAPLTTPQIIARLGLSRSPVYRALLALEAEGKIVRRRPPPPQQGGREPEYATPARMGGLVEVQVARGDIEATILLTPAAARRGRPGYGRVATPKVPSSACQSARAAQVRSASSPQPPLAPPCTRKGAPGAALTSGGAPS